MWQLLLAAAAAAGSTGLVAKYLFSPSNQISEGDQNEKERNPFDDDVKYQSPVVQRGINASGYDSNCENQEGIFRFLSPDQSGGKSGSKNVRKKKKVRGINASGYDSNCENQEGIFRFLSPDQSGGKSGSKNVRKKKKVKSEKRSACGDGGVELSKRRIVAVCLKMRRTSKNWAAKHGACSSKDSSLFNWGLGVGIVYMMSASKAEISKLNTTMDETAKVVQELKSELDRRKSSRSVQVVSSANEVTENSDKISSKQTQQVLLKSRSGNRDLNNKKVLGFPLVDDGECTSSVLTEEGDAEIMEVDQLEAELESELQKLPCYTTESSCHEDGKLNLHETNGLSSDGYQSHGVSPSELDLKLSHLLIEQQENQIVDLESELQSVQSKLHGKETELQALKDCVKRLTEFSLSTNPGDEAEAEEEHTANGIAVTKQDWNQGQW